MANKSPAAQDQRDIAGFIEWLEFCIVTYNHEFGQIGEKPEKFTRHDGYNFSMTRDDGTTVMMTMAIKK